MADAYEARLNDLIGRIHEKDVATMMKVASKNKMYPKDCLTNGALEKLVIWIISVEGKAMAYDKIMSNHHVDK
jgi:hypothetical protein